MKSTGRCIKRFRKKLQLQKGLGLAAVQVQKRKQEPILKMLEEQYGVQYDTYDTDKFKDFAYAMKVERTPDMFLLFREYENDPKPKIVRIATGFDGLLDLVEAVVYGLKTIGKIKNEEVK